MANEPNFPDQAKPGIRVLAQYTKAMSFVTKDGIQATGLSAAPQIDMGVDLQSEPVSGGEDLFETTLKLMARAHLSEDTVFELDLAYAGLFNISGTPQEFIEAVLMIECPRLLFPFARRQVADITREGGFPPLLVDPIDFQRLYEEQVQSSES